MFLLYLHSYRQPKLRIRFEGQFEPYCRFSNMPSDLRTIEHIFSNNKSIGEKWLEALKEHYMRHDIPFNPNRIIIPGYWVRVKIENEGKTATHRCVGKLVEIKDENGDTKKDFDAVVLHWVGHYEIENAYRVFSPSNRQFHVSKSNKFEPINLGIKDYQYLDILWTEFGFNTFKINCPENQPLGIQRGISTTFPLGIYYLRILVISDNANSAEINLKIVSNGNWDQIVVTEEEYEEPRNRQQRNPCNNNVVELTRINP